LTTLLSLALFYFGLFGGADAKALICLGLTIPLFPSGYETLLGYVHPFFPVVVVMIGFLSSLSVAIWIGVRNLPRAVGHRVELFRGFEHEPLWKKALAIITGYPSSISKLRSTYYLYPMEEIADEPNGARRRFHLFFSAEAEREQMVAELEKSLPKVGSPNEVWVSPGLPMLVFMAIGLVITLVLGDLIFSSIFLIVLR
jgi:preflagellin peptidase FlaK